MHHISDVVLEIDTLLKDITDIDIVGLYQDKNHAIELSHSRGVFYVRLDGANLYAGRDGSKATSMFYDQIAQIHDDEDRGTDPDFAALREILQARNAHVKDMLAAIGHERLASSLDGIELAKEFDFKSFQRIIKQNMTNIDVLNFAGYRPSEKENEECHTCIFFAAGGFCTKMDLPVKEEMICDGFKSLPMAEKNEEWSHVSHQEWEEAEHEEEHGHGIEGVQKDVSKDLIYTTEDNLESPANFNTGNRKPNVIMREFIPTDASEGFQIFAKNDVDEGIVEVQIVQRDGHWDVITKQRDYSDLGDPFQSVGEANTPKKVKLLEDDDKEGVDKLREVRGQDVMSKDDLEKFINPIAVAKAFKMAAGGLGKQSNEQQKQVSAEIGVPGEVESRQDRGVISIEDDEEPEVNQRWLNDSERGGRIRGSEVGKQSNEGGLGVDDPEALNDGTPASSQHYRRIKEDEENSKSSLATKAYVNDPNEVQKPIDPDEDGREALSSAETGTGTQAFSSGAVIDLPPEYKDAVHINSKASGGAGGEGVEGGGDGSASGISPMDPMEVLPTRRASEPQPSDYDSDLSEKDRTHPDMSKQDGGGGGAGGFGGDGGGTAMTAGGSSGSDATHTDTHGGRTGREKKYDSSLKLKDSMDAGSYEGVSQLPYPQDDDSRPARTVERHKPGDSEDGEGRASDDERSIPKEQQPIGEGYASSYVIAEEEQYSPTAMSEKPEHEKVRRQFIDEDNRLRSVNDPAAEQFTNLSMVSQDLQSHFMHSTDTPETLKNNDAFKVLTNNSIKKMDTGRTLVVAGWGNYYIVDREGHRLGLEGMRRALTNFLGKKEFANMNIFHSGIQVGQILRRFVDEQGKEWRTEVRPEGLFVVAAFRTDLEVSRKAMAEVLRGSMRGFSIAGNAKSKEMRCEHGKCWTEVNDLEIYEVTLCVAPMNPKSYITDIIQKPDPMLCPECYDVDQLEFDSSLRTR